MTTNFSDSGESENEEYFEESSIWWRIPEEVLLKVLLYLTPRDAISVSQCCRRWEKIARDDYIWKRYFHHDFKIDRNIGLKPGKKMKIFMQFVMLSIRKVIF